MKLLTTTNRYYLALATILFLLGTGLLYAGIQRALAHEVDEQLLLHQAYLTKQIKETGQIPAVTNPLELTIRRKPHPAGLSDTLLFDPVEQTQVPFREVSFPVQVQHTKYWLTLRKSLIETEDVLEVVLVVMLTVMLLLFGSLVLLNRWLSRWLWAPFQRTLGSLRGYQLQQPQSLELPVTPIDEFSELNQAVTQLTQRVAADYRALKEFTENAAHETQTPLAIMQAQLEQLLQLPELPETAATSVHELYKATLRLSRLHQALTLLSKIENRQFSGAVALPLDGVVREKLQQLQDFWEAKELVPEVVLTERVVRQMHPALADSLVGNLLQNAVKHNHRGGKLRVHLSPTGLSVTNTGPRLASDPMLLLERFRKHNAASDSPGLGLSIVHQICTYYGFQLTYLFDENEALHTLQVRF
ncbi:Signal transduction histidine kinase [Hymenobacter gelipurpurascens]|uniref:histidine kinase n=1 Tax=Hymenobacter gelipurpurascens TaxID=89968 RepID=A0A212UAA4_9BACT|nr:HAMP domain-containing sensor histidine kinase [Hymenobacter gelipurpurascens]SNC75080.1 Signal transduction histidine kinase [Hymenobacter gelipurpurascens]